MAFSSYESAAPGAPLATTLRWLVVVGHHLPGAGRAAALVAARYSLGSTVPAS
ncbi:MAG: hypothetical protein ACLQDY_25125 [Streptosporangiaceae bacterium]